MSDIAKHEFVSRPRDGERTTRKPLAFFDRIKILLALGGLQVFFVWVTLDDNPILPVSEAINQTLRDRWWITAFFVLELLRQLNYLVLEHWRGYYSFWTRLWGGIDGGVEKLSPWTRYRISRVFKVLAAIALLNGFVAWRTGRGFWEQLPHLPGDIGDFLFSTTQQMPFIFQVLLTGVFLIGQFALLFWFLSKGGIETYFPDDIRTRFTDVWGQDPVLDKVKENLIFLEDPKSIESRGGHVPSGVMLYGPPGTGKTLMAEAIAGETGLPFVFVEPGAFMNMFMGVGVLKVRGLFKKVRKLALKYGGVIVFFDEADSLGKRSLAAGGSMAASPSATWDSKCNGNHYLSERTQAYLWQEHFATAKEPAPAKPKKYPIVMGGLNNGGGGDMMALQALLAGLSGMTKPRGFFNRVVRRTLGMRPKAPPKYRWLMVMATNMPNSLDAALLRPGRIDRIYKVGYPSKDGRKRTFEGYLSRVKHELTDEQIDQLAVISPYATGATIKDTVNEALVFAIRDGRDTITWPDVLRAKHEKKHGVADDWEYIDRERHETAIHEACHAISFYRLDRNSAIDVATIERRGTIGGFVQPIPLEDRFSTWKSDREVDIMVSLSSLAGERMFFGGDNSDGVGSDLRNATTVAMEMEAFYGMGQTIASHIVTKAAGAAQSVETGSDRTWLESDVGERVEARLQALLAQVRTLLEDNRWLVLALAHAMERYKTVSGDDLTAIIEGHQGPIIDGRAYHDPVFQARLEEYHEAALHAHQHSAKVAIPLPGGESRDPVPVGLAAASTGNPGPAHDTGTWAPPTSSPAPPAGNGYVTGDAPTAVRATPSAPLPPAPKAKTGDGSPTAKNKNGKNGNGKNGNAKNGNGKNGSSKS